MGCDLQVVVFLSLLLFWIKHHSTTQTPLHHRTPPHNATITTTHDTPNAILHEPRYGPFRVGKGPRTRAYGPWRRTPNGTRGFPALFLFSPRLMWTSESSLPGGDTDAPKCGAEPRSRGHAPFEKLRGGARRGAGLRTRRGEWAERRGGAPHDKKGGTRPLHESRWFHMRVVGFT